MARRFGNAFKGADRQHANFGTQKDGGVNVKGAHENQHISHGERGGWEHHGMHAATKHGTESGHLPGGHMGKAIPKDQPTHHSGGTGGDNRVRNHFHFGVHHGGHAMHKGKHHAGKMTHHVGDHAAGSDHPHNLPRGFGKGPVHLED